MSDPTDATPDGSQPIVPEPPDHAAGGPIGDETARIPEPEVAWSAPDATEASDAPRAMPWEAPAAAAASAAVPPAQPTTPAPTADPGAAPTGDPGAAPTGVLSAATVGWVAPPPEPVATGQPGWVIASTGTRFVAYWIDGIISVLLLWIGVAVALAIAPSLADGGGGAQVAYAVASAGLYYLYFVGFWTSGGQATPGMRLLKLRVANASDGKRLAIGPATIRWLALGFIFTVISIIPALALLGLLVLIWEIILLVSTATDPMHQGFHDRWAKSVVVRPQGAGSGSGVVVACLIVVVIIILFMLVSVIGLIFLGTQVSTILSTVGDSI